MGTAKEGLLSSYDFLLDTAKICLAIKMPDGSTELIINQNAKSKIDYIRNARGRYRMNIEKAIERMESYKRMHTDDYFNIAINALEKQMPKEHHHTRVRHIDDEVRESVCPNCLYIIITHKDGYPEYCNWCGQRLDWSGEDE